MLKNKEKKTKLKKQPLVIGLAVITTLTLAVSIVYGQKFQGKLSGESQNASERTIVGVWRTVVTLRNCQTGDPVAPSFQGLFTFHKDGIMSEWGVGPGGTPALRSPGHGLWHREHGWQDYAFTFFHYRYNASGVLLGSQRVRATLQLEASGDELTTSSISETLDTNDNVVGSGCATAVATRFE